MTELRRLRLRWTAVCATCGTELAAGTSALWDATAKVARCVGCPATTSPEPGTPSSLDSAALELGVAGASALGEYERRSERERRRKEEAVARDAEWRRKVVERRPVLGRVRAALKANPVVGPESHSTRAWKTGAAGEERVAEILAGCAGVVALHDRRIPGSKANIDHVAVSARGVVVIDAKKYEGAVEIRDKGSFFRRDDRLFVRGRDQSKLVEGVRRQVDIVARVLADAGHVAVPVRGVLCFVGAEWPLVFRRRLVVDGVTAVWPLGLPDVLRAPETSSGPTVDELVRILAAGLPPAR